MSSEAGSASLSSGSDTYHEKTVVAQYNDYLPEINEVKPDADAAAFDDDAAGSFDDDASG